MHFKPSFDEILAALPSDEARAAQCRAWVAETNARWTQGQRECVADMLNSTDWRYRRMSAETRAEIGRMKWSSSPTAKGLGRDAEMFRSWALMWGASRS